MERFIPLQEEQGQVPYKKGSTGRIRPKNLRPDSAAALDPDPAEIVLKYWPQISYRVRNSIGQATPDCEDVASEILVGVIEALRREKFRGESSLGTFIYAITTNKIIDHIRQKKRPPNEIPEPGHAFDPYVHVESQERIRLVAGAIRKLKPRYADILYLHYYLDVPQSEIAAIYGLSTGRMNTLIRKARAGLKELMKTLPLRETRRRR